MTRFLFSLQISFFLPAALASQISVTDKIFPEFLAAAEETLENAEALSKSLFAEDRAREDLQIRKAPRLPSLQSFAQYHYQTEQFDPPVGGQDSERFLYGLTLRQPLYHWGALKANHEVGKILLQTARQNTVTLRKLLRNELQRRALGYYIAIRENQFAQTNLQHYARLLEQAESSTEQGVISLTELETARQNHRNATQHQISTLTAKLSIHHRLLKDFSLQEEKLDEIPNELPLDLSIDLKTWKERVQDFTTKGFREHPEYQAILSNIEVQEKHIDIAKAGNRPSVDLVVGANQDDTTYMLAELDDRFREIYYAGVRVNWYIFDGYATRARINTAQTNLDQARKQKHYVALKLAQDARQSLHEIQNAEIRLRLLKQTLETRQKRHEQVKLSHENGQIPDTELANSAFDLAYHEHLHHVEYARAISHLLYAELLTTLKVKQPETNLNEK